MCDLSGCAPARAPTLAPGLRRAGARAAQRAAVGPQPLGARGLWLLRQMLWSRSVSGLPVQRDRCADRRELSPWGAGAPARPAGRQGGAAFSATLAVRFFTRQVCVLEAGRAATLNVKRGPSAPRRCRGAARGWGHLTRSLSMTSGPHPRLLSPCHVATANGLLRRQPAGAAERRGRGMESVGFRPRGTGRFCVRAPPA